MHQVCLPNREPALLVILCERLSFTPCPSCVASGPYSDVQFMRFVLNLKSVACLPLVSLNGRMLGVLRLGFEESCPWSDKDKVGVAEQSACVVSLSQLLHPGQKHQGG